MRRKNAIMTGFAIFGVGVLVTAVSYFAAAPGGTYVVTAGAIVVGIVRLARAFAMPLDEDASGAEVDYDDPRWAKSRGVQIAGKPCAACDKRIFGQAEGRQCKRCDAIVHRTCMQDHKAKAHPPRS